MKTELIHQLSIDHKNKSGDVPISSGSQKSIWILTIVLMLCICFFSIYFYRLTEKNTAMEPVLSTSSNVVVVEPVILEATGYVTAEQKATVSSEIAGKLVEISVEEGDQVKSGQILARLDDSLVNAEVKLTFSQLKAAEHAVIEKQIEMEEAIRNLDRIEQLFSKQLISKEEIDNAKTQMQIKSTAYNDSLLQVEIVNNNVKLMQERARKTIIRAPFSGVVVQRNAQIGEIVSPSSAGGGFTRTGIYTIVDMSSLVIEVDINEKFIQRISVGQKGIAVLDAYPDWDIPVTVSALVPAADRQKATVRVKLDFEYSDKRILPDMGVSVAFMDTLNVQSEFSSLVKTDMNTSQ